MADTQATEEVAAQAKPATISMARNGGVGGTDGAPPIFASVFCATDRVCRRRRVFQPTYIRQQKMASTKQKRVSRAPREKVPTRGICHLLQVSQCPFRCRRGTCSAHNHKFARSRTRVRSAFAQVPFAIRVPTFSHRWSVRVMLTWQALRNIPARPNEVDFGV